MTGQELSRLLIEAGAVPVPGKATMFELTSAADESVLTRVFDGVRGLAEHTFLLPSEDPVREEPELEWTHATSGTWILPPDASTEVLLRGMLRAGAWRIYAADEPAPVEDAPDLFRGPTIAALDFLERYGVKAVVDAWHDNTEWRVAVFIGQE